MIEQFGLTFDVLYKNVYELLTPLLAIAVYATMPGYWSTEFHIDKETYMRWFGMIQDMGANVIRVYTILSEDFYDAFYEYNNGREKPLYLIQGVWVNDYVLNSHHNIYDDAFCEDFYTHCKTAVDVIHGKKKIFKNLLFNFPMH